MSKTVILEGPRGTGKSTVARSIREKISEITLVNPTGFHEDGLSGYEKTTSYYRDWLTFLGNRASHDSTLVFDRFFFSEMVFSTLYKDYDFSSFYHKAVNHLCRTSDKVVIIYLVINDEEELARRLTRDKVPFGKAAESVKETFRQQSQYDELFFQLNAYLPSPSNLVLHTIDTSQKTPQEVEAEVLAIVGALHD